MPRDLITEEVSEGGPERAVHLADGNFRFGRRAWRSTRNQALPNSHDDAIAHIGAVPSTFAADFRG